jgi:hypothetical protein
LDGPNGIPCFVQNANRQNKEEMSFWKRKRYFANEKREEIDDERSIRL